MFNNIVAAAFAPVCLLSVLVSPAQSAPELVLYGGPVITLDQSDSVVSALAVEGGVISAVGSSEDVLSLADANTQRINLGGRALLPGFVDSHSHANGIGLQALSANLLPAPDGVGNSVADLQRLLGDYLNTDPNLLKSTGWLIGFGYDDSQLAEQRHPTRQELDAVSVEVPIIIIHQSGHLGVANTLALQLGGIDASTADPAGGVFRREGASGEPNGVMEESAFFGVLIKIMDSFGDELADEMLLAGLDMMARFGYTTAQEGHGSATAMESMARVAARGELSIDLVSYAGVTFVKEIKPAPSRDYTNRYRVGGLKLAIDGSPQGKTAWLTQPYHVVPEGQDADYRGYPAVDMTKVNSSVMRAFANDWQILVHANGDAAIDAMISAVRAAREVHPDTEIRPVLIHGQTLRFDQVALLQELRIFPSLFPMHTFYWGDWHRDSVLGPERAENISPTGWVRERGMMFATHTDAPVALPDSMRVLSATVTRTTRSGRVLGPAQRVDVMTALRAMTLWPAWQHFEEKKKGSLEVGKLADLVILSDDPLTVDPGFLDDLKVLATYKEARLIFSADEFDATAP